MKISKKADRQTRAIERFEKTIVAHKSGVGLTTKILKDKEISKSTEEIEKLRKKKLERAQTTVINTKANLK